MATPTTLPASFTAGQVLTAAQMNGLRGAFRVLQVVSTAKTDTFSTTAAVTAPVVVTGLTATITPQSTTSKIFVIASVVLGANQSTNQTNAFLYRNNAAILLGDASGSRTRVITQVRPDSSYVESVTMTFLDSPSSISALTYQVYVSTNTASGGTATVNRSFTNGNASDVAAGASTITVMEISE